ncbi:ATP-binding cassette domain-containing protein [Mesorhizobium opportunistum]|uniref:ATP-binding cassette domain-containing protein n=1 Tax=Mesorhizobium sp. M1121 TaxID=2957058 RepID=UPI0033379B27
MRSGEVAFLIGPSGGGKSTLVRCINFLETPTFGEIVFDGQMLCEMRGGAFIKPRSASFAPHAATCPWSSSISTCFLTEPFLRT